jgi:hypothetical protein
MRKIPFVVNAISLVVATGIAYAQKATRKDQLLGIWKVVVLKATSGDKVTYPLGASVSTHLVR